MKNGIRIGHIFPCHLVIVIGRIVRRRNNENLKYNYKGIICIEFSFIWGILSILFYYFIYPWINTFATNIINNNIVSFLLGLYYGIFIIDLLVSINLLIKLSKYSKKIDKVINVEKLKKELLKNNSNIMDKIYPYICINKFLKEK